MATVKNVAVTENYFFFSTASVVTINTFTVYTDHSCTIPVAEV